MDVETAVATVFSAHSLCLLSRELSQRDTPCISRTFQSRIWWKKKEKSLSNKTILCSYLMSLKSNRHFSVLNAKICRELNKKVHTCNLLLQRKTLSCAIVLTLWKWAMFFGEKSQQSELQDVRDSRVASVACTRIGKHVGISTREDSYFLIREKSKHVSSGIRTLAPETRKPKLSFRCYRSIFW